MVTITGTVTDADGASAPWSVVATQGAALPAGVTLQAIDGETLTSPTTMSNNYFARMGFTYAANKGWDSPSFFPFGVWGGELGATAQATRWIDLGLNVCMVADHVSQSVIQAANISLITSAQSGWTSYLNYNFTPGPETVGIETYDEPTTSAQFYNGMSTVPNSLQDGRFWTVNNGAHWVLNDNIPTGSQNNQGAWLNALQTSPNGTKRRIDLSSCDFYFFSAAGISGWDSQAPGAMFNGSYNAPLSFDQQRRGFLYGDFVEQQRILASNSQPIGSFVENGGPDSADTTAASYIQPRELNWAVWQSIIHGARAIWYFNRSFAGPGNGNILDNFAAPFYSNAANYPADGISIYQQAKNTNALVKQLAPVINSPFAIGYATVNPPSAKRFPLPLASSTPSVFTGVDICVHWYSNSFYIFASTRMSQTQTNIAATFTINGNAAASLATVINESRTIPIVGNQFTDTFVKASDVHIYQIS